MDNLPLDRSRVKRERLKSLSRASLELNPFPGIKSLSWWRRRRVLRGSGACHCGRVRWCGCGLGEEALVQVRTGTAASANPLHASSRKEGEQGEERTLLQQETSIEGQVVTN